MIQSHKFMYLAIPIFIAYLSYEKYAEYENNLQIQLVATSDEIGITNTQFFFDCYTNASQLENAWTTTLSPQPQFKDVIYCKTNSEIESLKLTNKNRNQPWRDYALVDIHVGRIELHNKMYLYIVRSPFKLVHFKTTVDYAR